MEILDKIKSKEAVIGIIGLGYVGLPLALEFTEKKFKVVGFDVDESKIPLINEGRSYIKHISAEKIKRAVDGGLLSATNDFTRIPEVDAVLICVPTPLDEHREPDMSFVESTAKIIAKNMRKGQLITLESTTYPGTTRELLLPLFENSQDGEKLTVGKDFYLSFSPEREDPNNPNFTTATIPKVVGGVTEACRQVAGELYEQIIVKVVRVSSPEIAEATKLLENIYRSVNIALVNEMKVVLDRMGIDVWEVIEAASTKPFGFQPFYPGPGLGGHCIPIDPFYLTWKAREFNINTRFIELAGEINTAMPEFVIDKAADLLNHYKKALNGAKILILGVAYKKDIDDMRESPSLKLIDLLRDKGAEVDYNDPFVPILPKTRKYNFALHSVDLTPENIAQYDMLLLSTDHTDYDYSHIFQHANAVLDTRNAFEKKGITGDKLFKA